MDPATSDTDRPDGADRRDGIGPVDGPDRRDGIDRLDGTDLPSGEDRADAEAAVLSGAPRQPGRAIAVGAAVVLGISLLGAPVGLLWAALAPDVPVIKTTDGAVLAHPQPEEFIAADGWFSILILAFGVLAALGVWWVRPRWRGPGGMLVAVFGALGAALVAWGLGRQIGLGGYRERLADAPVGQALAKPADLRAGGFEWLFDVIPTIQGDVLLGAFGAAVTYTLLAGWSNYPDLVPGRAGHPAPDPAFPAGENPAAGSSTAGSSTAGSLAGGDPADEDPPAGEFSSGSPETRDPQSSPAPPVRDEAGPARD